MFRCLNAKMLKYKGFSLLETLVVIAVITVGLVGVMGLIVYITSIGQVSPNEIIAANLAQEGIEVVRNIRDGNWLEKNEWYINICGPGAGNTWAGIIDYDDTQLDKKSGDKNWSFSNCGETCRLKVDANGIYSHDASGTDTSFYRMVITDKDGQDKLKVFSKVKWTNRDGTTHNITVEDHLYDWR